MRSKGNAPNAAQKRWMDAVGSLGCLVCLARPVELHHVVGCAARHNKVPIGHE